MPQESKATVTIRVSSELIEQARELGALQDPPLLGSRAVEACIRTGLEQMSSINNPKKKTRAPRKAPDPGSIPPKPCKRKR